MLSLTVVIILSVISIYLKKVTISGGVTGMVVSFFILYNSWENFLLFGLFFVLGSIATKWQFERKQKLGLSQENEGIRSWIHAVANGGIPAIFSLLAICFPNNQYFTYAATAAIASALSDTLSSELGNLYGKRYFDILTLKKGRRGDDGVISFEGTIVGLLGSFLIALLFAILTDNFLIILPIAIAGFIGNISDSYLGATIQRKGYIDNHLVNFINTFIAAILVILWFQV
ncbi:MAG: hypothetical protein ACI97N_000535 [Cognaticolwellia sp.]|jgi:uncharacterized protein (TIGR00297 family)